GAERADDRAGGAVRLEQGVLAEVAIAAAASFVGDRPERVREVPRLALVAHVTIRLLRNADRRASVHRRQRHVLVLANERPTLGAYDRDVAAERSVNDLVVRAELEEAVGIRALFNRMVVGVVVHR